MSHPASTESDERGEMDPDYPTAPRNEIDVTKRDEMTERTEAAITGALNAYFKPTISDEGTARITRSILAALKAARIELVEVAETQIDPEWGDEYWSVPLTEYRMGGKLRLDTEWKSGPRIAQTVVPNPLPVADVDAYVSALLAAKAAAVGARITVEEA